MIHTTCLLAAACGALVTAALPAVCAAAETQPEVQVEFRYFAPKVSGSVKGDDYYTARDDSNKLDLKDDLGIDKGHAPEVLVRYGKWRIDYMHLSSSKDGYYSGYPMRHKSHFYKGNLDTDLDFDSLSLDWQQDISRDEQQQVYWTAGLRYMREAADCTGDVYGSINDERDTDSDSASGIVPTVGIGGVWQMGSKGSLQGRLSGMPLGSHGHVFDVELGGVYSLARDWQITAGWRYLNLKLKKDDKTAEYKGSGPYVGVAYSF